MYSRKIDYFDARWGWLLALSIFVFAALSDTPFPQVAWSACVAAVIGMGALHVGRYRFLSFYSIFVGTHLIFYPGAVFFNLLLEWPAVRFDLWEDATSAMVGCSIGLLCSALGVLARTRSARKRANTPWLHREPPVTSVTFNVWLSTAIPLVAILRYSLGLYFHLSVDPDYRFDQVGYLNGLEHLLWIGYCGLILQAYRSIKTRALSDLYIFLALVLGAVLIFLPSGGRYQAFGFLPFCIVAYVTWERQVKRKAFALVAGVLLIVSLSVLIAIYRDIVDLSTRSTVEKYGAMIVETGEGLERSGETWEGIFVGRLSDFVAAGRIIAETPEPFHYRYFDGMSSWWQIAIPYFLRPEKNRIDIIEGAQVTLEYGVTDGPHTSAPVTLIGDLFSRFGWAGVCVGMFAMGLVLSYLDKQIGENMDALWKLMALFLYSRLVMFLFASSLLVTIITVTRDLLIIYLVSRFLAWMGRRGHLKQ